MRDPLTPNEVGNDLIPAVARLYRRLRAERAATSMGETHAAVLGLLTRDGPRTLRELSDYERVTPPSMNQTVNHLVAAGFVRREAEPNDRRKVLFVVTEAGRTHAAETRRVRHAWLDERLDALDSDDLATLGAAARILRTIADS